MYRRVYTWVVPRSFFLPALLLFGCSSAARRGDTVILASGADLQSANPLLTTHPLARQVQRHALLVTLIRLDSALAPVPYFAREWNWSSDRTELSFRTGPATLAWHDGVPTTARDAAWTIEAARAVETGYPRRAELEQLREVAAPDDSTLVLRFDRPQPGVPDLLADLAILPRHHFADIPLGELRRAEWNRNPVGNGPYRFGRHEPNRRWVFSANAAFPAELGGPPLLDRLVIAVVDEPTTKLAALTAGELDLAGISPAHAEFVKRDRRLTVLDYPVLFSYALIFNTRRPPFDRLEARRAVAAAIDRNALVEGVLFGYGTASTHPVPPGLAPAAEPEEAAEPPAPLPPGMEFELLTVGSGEAALEQLLQAQLAAAGIRVRIRQLELSTFLDRVEGPGAEFAAAVTGVPADLALGYLVRVAGLAGLPAPPARDRLVDHFLDSLPATFLYHARGVQGMNRRVKGVRMDVRGELVTLSRWEIRDER